MIPNRRYREYAIVVAIEDSRNLGDSDVDYLIRRLRIGAEETEQDDGENGWDMVAAIETEVCDIDGSGTDNGHLEAGPEIYRIPFPQDLKFRKSVIRLCKEHPQFFRTDTWGRFTLRPPPSNQSAL